MLARASSPRSSASTRPTCAWSRPTPICARSTSAPTARASRFMVGNAAIDAARKLRAADRASRGRRGAGQVAGASAVRLVERRARSTSSDPERSASHRARRSSCAEAELRHARRGRQATTRPSARRRLPRRHDRRVAGLLVHRARRRGRGRRRDRRDQRARRSGSPTTAAARSTRRIVEGQMEGSVYMGARRGADGGARRRPTALRRLHTRPVAARLPHPDLRSTRPRSQALIVESHRSRRARTAPRRPARARCTPRSPRSPTRSTTRWACGSPSCRSRRRGCWQG